MYKIRRRPDDVSILRLPCLRIMYGYYSRYNLYDNTLIPNGI